MFARIQLFGGEVDALLIPDAAVVSDQTRKIVFTVGADDIVVAKPVELWVRIARPARRAERAHAERPRRRQTGSPIRRCARAPRSRQRPLRSVQRPTSGPRTNRCPPRLRSPVFWSPHAFLPLLHRPADLRNGSVDHHHSSSAPSPSASLPIAEYPEIAPPTVNIAATYPGASAQVIADTVATPIEQEVNGVDDMLYIVSQSTGDGRLSINVVFKPGTNIDQAQVLVQNRVAVAEPRLPEDVRRLGITVRKASPDLMMVVHMISPDGIARPAVHLQLRDALREGRAGPHRRRRRRQHFRRTRLFDARLARPRARWRAQL